MTILTRKTKQLYRRLREMSYDGMARQVSGWILRETGLARKSGKQQPIKLDFNIPKKHRLNWIHRTIRHLPR